MRVIFSVLLLSFIYVAQRFWFKRGFRIIDSTRRQGLKVFGRYSLISAIVLLILTSLDPFGHSNEKLWEFALSVSKLWLFASTLGYLAVVIARVAGLLFSKIFMHIGNGRKQNTDLARRAFLRRSTLYAGSLPFFATGYGYFVERFSYRVKKIEVPVANLPRGLDGLRIVQLSDIHMGDFMSRGQVRKAVDMANGLNADLAVITGDFITFKNDPLADCIQELSRLHAPLGTWGCNGNHELNCGVQALAQRLFAENGMRLLRNENVQINWRGETFNLIGMDFWMGEEHPGILMKIGPLVRKDMPNILLSHSPDTFYWASQSGIELSLAGHTHGGQVRLGILNPASLFTKFVSGMYFLPFEGSAYHKGDKTTPFVSRSAALYVNRGLGTLLVPVRLGVPPEISLLILRSAV